MTTRAPSPCSADSSSEASAKEDATQGKPTDDARLTEEETAVYRALATRQPFSNEANAITRLLAALRASQAQIDDAHIAACETQKDWKHRCYHIMGALGLDFGDPDFEMPDEIKRAEAAERERDALLTVREGHKKLCYYCQEPCDSLAGNPSLWPVALCHEDEPGVVKWHHVGCVDERLAERDALRAAAQPVVDSYGSGDWEIRGGTRKLIAALAAALAPRPPREGGMTMTAPYTAAELAAISAVAADPNKTYQQSLRVYAAFPRLVADLTRAREALAVCNRVLRFDLRKMIDTNSPNYNQAVRDAANAVRAALGEEPADLSRRSSEGA